MGLFIVFNKVDNSEVARYTGYGNMLPSEVQRINNHDPNTMDCMLVEMTPNHIADDYSLDNNGMLVINPNADADAIDRQADKELANPVVQSLIETMWESLPGGSRPVDAVAMVATAKQKLITKLGG